MLTRPKNILKSRQKITSSPEKFKSYLALQTQLYEFSRNNQKLIYAANPNASMVKTRKEWQALGRNVKLNVEKIELYKPSLGRVNSKPKEYTKIPYYDISDTHGGAIKIAPKISDVEAAKLLNKIQDRIQIILTKEVPNQANFNIKDGLISVQGDLDISTKMCLVFREKAHQYLFQQQGENYNRENANSIALAIAYSLCEKYGIDAKAIDIEAAAHALKDQDIEKISDTLQDIQQGTSELSKEFDKAIEIPKDKVQPAPDIVKPEKER